MDEASWLLIYAQFQMENHAWIGFARVIRNKVTSPDDALQSRLFSCKVSGLTERERVSERERDVSLKTITYNLWCVCVCMCVCTLNESKFIYLSNLSIFRSRPHARPRTHFISIPSRKIPLEWICAVSLGGEKKKRRDLDKKRKGGRRGVEGGQGDEGDFWPSCTNTVWPLSRRNLNWLDKSSRNKAPLYQKHLPNVITTLNKERRPREKRGRRRNRRRRRCRLLVVLTTTRMRKKFQVCVRRPWESSSVNQVVILISPASY